MRTRNIAEAGSFDSAGRGMGLLIAGKLRMAANSRATPAWERQSPRLLVTSTSMTESVPCGLTDSTGNPALVSASAMVLASSAREGKKLVLSHSRLIFIRGIGCNEVAGQVNQIAISWLLSSSRR